MSLQRKHDKFMKSTKLQKKSLNLGTARNKAHLHEGKLCNQEEI